VVSRHPRLQDISHSALASLLVTRERRKKPSNGAHVLTAAKAYSTEKLSECKPPNFARSVKWLKTRRKQPKQIFLLSDDCWTVKLTSFGVFSLSLGLNARLRSRRRSDSLIASEAVHASPKKSKPVTARGTNVSGVPLTEGVYAWAMRPNDSPGPRKSIFRLTASCQSSLFSYFYGHSGVVFYRGGFLRKARIAYGHSAGDSKSHGNRWRQHSPSVGPSN
jgi:hypothetical protein